MQHACRPVPDDAMCAKMLRGIAQVESKDKDIGLHADGVSHGRYGVTQVSVDELVRVKMLDRRDLDLDDPTVNAMVARLYLLVQFERAGGSWWNAVEKYHGNRDKTANSSYAAKVWAAMDDQR
jgi:hypothetical protein